MLAAQRGTPGRSYVLGGENMSLREMLATLADVRTSGRPRVRLSARGVLPIVRSAEWLQANVLRREPVLPSEPVRMATTRMEYDDDRTRWSWVIRASRPEALLRGKTGSSSTAS